MDKSNLYGWLFIYNHYTGKWYAAKKEDSNLLFSDVAVGIKNKKVLSSTCIDTLQYIICKTQGTPKKIKALLNQYK